MKLIEKICIWLLEKTGWRNATFNYSTKCDSGTGITKIICN